MTALYTIRDALSAFFSSPLRKWSSVFLLAILALGGAYYYQMQSLGKVQAGYTISNAARFISGNSDYLSRTPGSAGNRQTWTYSVWFKRGALGTAQVLLNAGDGSSNNFTVMQFTAGNTMNFNNMAGGSYNLQMATAAVFRDPAAWYHFVLVFDSTNAT